MAVFLELLLDEFAGFITLFGSGIGDDEDGTVYVFRRFVFMLLVSHVI